MINVEKWNLIVDKYFSLKNAQESIIQTDWEMYCADLFGYKRLFHEIDAQRRLTVGSGGTIIPDIILRVNNNDIFDIELKQYSLPFHETFEQQLISYLNQTHLPVGMIVCNKIYLYYYEYDTINISKIEIPFEKDHPDGIALMEMLTKDTFSKQKIKDYIFDKISRQKRLDEIRNTINNDWIQDIVKIKLLENYEKKDVDEVLDSYSFSFATKTKNVVVIPSSSPQNSHIPLPQCISTSNLDTDISSYIYEWCNQKHNDLEIYSYSKPTSKKYFRFSISELDSIFPEQIGLKSGWGNGYFSLLEIIKEQRNFKIWLVFSNKNAPEQFKKTFNQVFELINHFPKNDNWEWTTMLSTAKFCFNENTTKNDVFEALDNQFYEIREKVLSIISRLDK